MRACYHLETHSHPDQVDRLVRLLHTDCPEALIVISHDERADPLPTSVTQRDRVVVRADRGGYGDFQHTARWLATARWLREQGESIDWLVNLSGQCYPVRPLPVIESELAAAAGRGVDGFVQTQRVGTPESGWSDRLANDRYHFRHYRLGPSGPRHSRASRWVAAASHVQPWFRVSTATGVSVAVRRPLPERIRATGLHGGSFFAALAQPAIGHILDVADNDAELMTWFRTVITPAEVFFQTVLAFSDTLTIESGNRRFVDFALGGGNHPAALDDTLLDRALASGADFARKFDERAHPGLLDRVDLVAHGGLRR